MSLDKTLYHHCLVLSRSRKLSTGPTQENVSIWLKIVDFEVKPQLKKKIEVKPQLKKKKKRKKKKRKRKTLSFLIENSMKHYCDTHVYVLQPNTRRGEHTDHEVEIAEYVGGVVTLTEDPCKHFFSFCFKMRKLYMVYIMTILRELQICILKMPNESWQHLCGQNWDIAHIFGIMLYLKNDKDIKDAYNYFY